MKQKLIFVLSLVAMAWSSAVYAVERVAPTLPTAQTPESGKSYWIYNVGTGLFLGNSSTNVSGLSLDGNEMWVTIGADGWYQLRRNTDAGYYFYDNGNNTNIKYSSTVGSYYDTWTVTPTENGYTFQRYNKNSRYNAEEFVGCPSGSTTNVYPNVVDGNIVWQFFTPTDAVRYSAEKKLYAALEKTNGTDLEGLDWFLEEYETLYANRATISSEELIATANTLNNLIAIHYAYQAPELNEYPIIFTSSEGTYGQSESYTWALTENNTFSRKLNSNTTSTLTAIINVDQEAKVAYSLYGPRNSSVTVYVDGVETRCIHDNMGTQNFSNAGGYDHYIESLPTAGTHTIQWVYHNTHSSSSQTAKVLNILCVAAPLIEVNLLEAGSLGTEVLYHVNHIKDVKRLKVSGPMNSDDWARIQMMTNLFELDMKDAITDAVPANQFDGSSTASAKMYLHKVILPDVLETINNYAFRNTHVEEVVFPQSLTTIGNYAFSQTHLKEIILPEVLESLGTYAFEDNYHATLIDLGKSIKSIPTGVFRDNYYAQFILPNTVESIGLQAFRNCNNMTLESLPTALTSIGENAFGYCNKLNPIFPVGLKTIGTRAFESCIAIDALRIPESVTSIGEGAFVSCTSMKYAQLPEAFYSIHNKNIFSGCNALEKIRLNSPTVVTHSSYQLGIGLSNITVEVPSFLRTSYLLDEYWYNAKAIEGFSTAEIQDWIINQPLVLNARDRFEGNPNITIAAANDRLPSLKINGDAPQEINNLVFYGNRKNYVNYPGQILSNSNYVKVNGNVRTYLETDEKRWFFFSLPFDVKVSDIAPANGAQYAIRYYDGANRAANGASGSWKNYEADDIIPAGTGFIYQTNISTWSGFPAVDNESKQNVVSYKEAKLTLQVNPSENTANRGWNLIGNPYQCYYNNHMLNFTAPITVWNASNKTYTAYSLTDDDYAIRPNEAFFVQCPNEELNTISFPLQGRQLNAVIESQNAANVRAVEGATTRQLIDLEVSNGELSDKTRVVVNEKATLGYDMGSDASKFMSADAPQIYTIGEDGTEYAINERPMDEGEVQLGFYTQKSGAFTLSMPRCQAKKVYLVDEFEHLTVDLTAQDYGFTAAEGKQEARFRLVVDAGEATGIESISTTLPQGEKAYNLNGQRVDGSYKGIVIKNGKKYLAK